MGRHRGAVRTPADDSPDDGRPGDDPDQTQWHFGFRFMAFWVLPFAVVGGAFLWWDLIQALRAGASLGGGGKGSTFVFLYPGMVVGWVYLVVGYHRAKRRGETPVPGSYKPRRPTTPR